MLTATRERKQKTVVEDIVTVLPSVFADPVSSGSDVTEPTTKQELFTSVYSSLAEYFGRVKSDTGYTDFVEAVTEITEAHQEACSGPPDERPSPKDIPGLVERFARLPLSEARELRKIFGEMLCIKNEVHSSRMKRQDPCAGPGAGFDQVLGRCQFFARLNKSIEDEYKQRLEVVFNFNISANPFQCLAFVVDTTASMQEEIEAVKGVIRGFVSSEGEHAGCYVITQFNDHASLDRWPYYYPFVQPQRGVGKPGNGIHAVSDSSHSFFLNPVDYGPAGVFDTTSVADLDELLNFTDSLNADGGQGDCLEFGMHGIYEALLAKHQSYGSTVMHNFSQIIVITNSGATDSAFSDNVTELAHKREVCIHLLLSKGGVCPDFPRFDSYMEVSNQTGGITVLAEPTEIKQLINLFGRFRFTYQKGSSCKEFYRNRRNYAKRNTPERCQHFTIDVFTNILQFLITTQESQSNATVRKPSGEIENIDLFSGYGSLKVLHPEVGEWSVCVKSGTLSISFNNQVLLDFVVTFIEKNEQLPTRISTTMNVPPGCKLCVGGSQCNIFLYTDNYLTLLGDYCVNKLWLQVKTITGYCTIIFTVQYLDIA